MHIQIKLCKQLSEQNHLQFPYWQVECDAASHILQIYHVSCTSWIKLLTICHLPPHILSSQRIQPQYKGTRPSPCWCSAHRSTPFRKIPDKMTFREISDMEGYRGLIYNASDVIRLSNATETSIMLCGKAQPPLVWRGGLEPPLPAPKARALKG